jgi:hypothetical protein
MMSEPTLSHITDETLELYSMGRLSELETEKIEEHLLLCTACQDLLVKTEEFVHVARIATKELAAMPQKEVQSEPWWRRIFAVPMPAMAAVACAMLAFFVLIPRDPATAVVDLQAMRGPEAPAQAPSNAKLTLRLSLQGLEAADPLRAKVADATGKIVAETSTERSGEMVIGHTDKLAPGSYWVRLYSGEELLREYGLTVR